MEGGLSGFERGAEDANPARHLALPLRDPFAELLGIEFSVVLIGRRAFWCGGPTAPERNAILSDHVDGAMKRSVILATLLLSLLPFVAHGAKVPELKRVSLAIQGMHCSSCATGIHAMLKRTPGVIRAEVSYPRRQALVDYDAGKTSPGKIVETIEKLGYKATIRK